ncbi:MAG: response regulator [Candidatus Hydrogenedentota bacterium]|nr:MAG: response regulator [Candidatus Hydrogenedentota bacterium]
MGRSDGASSVITGNNVLIIDDEIESLRGVIDFFKKIEWKVTTAIDEKEAILEFERANPCLVLLDLVLEKECGFEVLRRIRRLNSDSKVIIISKYFDYELIKQAMKAGAIGFVQKAEADRLPSGFASLLRGAITLQ